MVERRVAPVADLNWSTDIQLAVKGDRDAFARLIRDMQSEMYRLARTLLSQDEDCADAIQEAILNAYRSVHRLREPAYFRTWLYRILIRECQMTYRRRRKTAASDKLPEIGTSASGPDLDLQAAVNRLREPLRTIIKLHYFADMSLNQIAEMYKVSEGTLKSRLHRARRQLAKDLTEPGEGEVRYEFR
jgi:RNA polymerase sigma factor (sigma-70 family)